MEMYLVGGAVRDKLMGVAPNDFDFSVVLDKKTDLFVGDGDGTHDYFKSMKANLMRDHNVKFFDGADAPEHFTAKGKFPKGHKFSNLVAEFVLARKEGVYHDGRRPSSVQMGSLHDDLARRDFTMNAIAQDMDGNFIDPFNGIQAIEDQTISAVGDATTRFEEDALRVLRAIRFSVTLGFSISDNVRDALLDRVVIAALANNISDERKSAELNKMFKHDAVGSMFALIQHIEVTEAVFGGKVNLEATLKQKGFEDKQTLRAQGQQKLSVANNGCQCNCHTEKGVMHFAACC